MLIGLVGYARSGKDSTADLLVAQYGYTKLGFADGVREMALAIDPFVQVDGDRHYTEGSTPFARYSTVLRAIGYEAAKSHPDVRQLLQRIGTEGGRSILGPGVWVDALVRKLGGMTAGLPITENIVINDVRFENEADLIKGFGGVVVRVVRPGYGGHDPHASEVHVADIDADLSLVASNLTQLAEAVTLLVEERLPEWQEQHNGIDPPVIGATRVYLAAPWVHKATAAAAKQRFVDAGFNVVSGWTERENSPAEIDATSMQTQALLDETEVACCDVLVVLGLDKSEGKASEMGMALAQGKRIVLVKTDRVGNIFYHLPTVERVDTVEDAIELLTGRIAVYREGDNVVRVATGEVVARKLGTVTDETVQSVAQAEAAASAVDTILDPLPVHPNVTVEL